MSQFSAKEKLKWPENDRICNLVKNFQGFTTNPGDIKLRRIWSFRDQKFYHEPFSKYEESQKVTFHTYVHMYIHAWSYRRRTDSKQVRLLKLKIEHSVSANLSLDNTRGFHLLFPLPFIIQNSGSVLKKPVVTYDIGSKLLQISILSRYNFAALSYVRFYLGKYYHFYIHCWY
jgi:hypothetical protein